MGARMNLTDDVVSLVQQHHARAIALNAAALRFSLLEHQTEYPGLAAASDAQQARAIQRGLRRCGFRVHGLYVGIWVRGATT